MEEQKAVSVLGRVFTPGSRGGNFQIGGTTFSLPPSLEHGEGCVQGHLVRYNENPYGRVDPVTSTVSSLTLR